MAKVMVAGYGLRVARLIFQPVTRNTQLATGTYAYFIRSKFLYFSSPSFTGLLQYSNSVPLLALEQT